ncbi:MAG: lactate racemase domain-containing protein [Acidobacteria bacterium]|nr:lactate racemase domain-containing protein [Acidobacteriota bacterium]
MGFPKFILVRQKFEAPSLQDIPRAVESQIDALRLEGKIIPGQTVAVACGSRGIAHYSQIIGATVRALKKKKLEPFIIPAMGSHGAATAEGQKEVLAKSGVSESDIGAPVRSSLDVNLVGETEDHIPVCMDKFAFQADHVVLINRVKGHTDFGSDIGSGLLKMMAVGLGKPTGAATCHRAILRHGFPRTIQLMARKVMETGKILFGLAIVENAYAETAEVTALLTDVLEQEEKALLKKARRLAARLPFDEIDVLVIDEMGKKISGTGFDTNVVGRIHQPLLTDEPEHPAVKRIVVCNLSDDSYGNALGVGLADFITRRLADKINVEALYANCIAALQPERGKIPLTLINDREAIEVAIRSVGMISPEKLKVMRIRNTLRLGEVAVSEGYADEISKRKDLTIVSGARSLRFDALGNLQPFDQKTDPTMRADNASP